MSKKLISVVIPTCNEIDVIDELYERVTNVMKSIEAYEYEIVFFDDGSTDGSKTKIEELCAEHSEVKCVMYSKNFGYLKNTFYAMQQAKGDCAIIIHADLQNPPEMIPEFIKRWEDGAQVVQGIKNQSKENKFVYFLRTVFYYLMIKFFGIKMTAHATEFELFDKSLIDVLKKIKVNSPFLRGIVSEYATRIDYIYYTQDARKKGKSKFNISKYYDFAICGIAQFSRNLPRKVIAVCVMALLALIAEFCVVIIPSFGELPVTEIMDSVMLRCIFVALCLFIILVSVMFEYIIALIDNLIDKPFIVEEKRINY